jgi:hypothetical protein
MDACVAALVNAGYRASGTHAAPGCVKTDAPPAFIWAIARAWEARPGNAAAPRFRDNPATVAHAILVQNAPGPKLTTGASEGAAPAPAADALPAVDFSTATPAFVAWRAGEANGTSTGSASGAASRSSGPRFIGNPQAHWGPGTRASGAKAASVDAKRTKEGTSEPASESGTA